MVGDSYHALRICLCQDNTNGTREWHNCVHIFANACNTTPVTTSKILYYDDNYLYSKSALILNPTIDLDNI